MTKAERIYLLKIGLSVIDQKLEKYYERIAKIDDLIQKQESKAIIYQDELKYLTKKRK